MIGGDEAVAIEIRQGIVAEFAKRHLKGMVEGEIGTRLNGAISECRIAAYEAVKEYFSQNIDGTNWVTGSSALQYLSVKQKQAIQQYVRDCLQEQIGKEVAAALKGCDIDNLIRVTAQSIVANEVQGAVRKEVKRLIERITTDALNSVPSRPDVDVGPRRVIT